MMTVLIFIVVLGILVFVHEFGHFMTAKWRGVGVEEFGFGFPPRLVGLQRQNGHWKIIWGKVEAEDKKETVYSLNLIPVGGFVKIKGENGEQSEEKDSFAAHRAWERALIIAMGVIANTLLTIVLISIGFAVGLPQVIDQGISSYAKVSDKHIEILSVLSGSSAEKSGLKIGDTIVAINSQPTATVAAVKELMSQNVNKAVEISIERQGAEVKVEATPEILAETKTAGVGIALAEIGQVRYPLWLALPKGVMMTGSLIKAIFQSFGSMIHDLVLGKKVGVELAGPVGIAVMTGEAARMGWIYLLQFVSLLSINLAIINILPFPALDGGRLLFILLEKIRRRPVSQRLEVIIHNSGFVLLLFLVILVTYHDLARYSGRIGAWLVKLIQ